MRKLILNLTLVVYLSGCSSTMKRADDDLSPLAMQLRPSEVVLFGGLTKPNRDVELPALEVARDIKHQICDQQEQKVSMKFKVLMPKFINGVTKAEKDRIQNQYLTAAKEKIKTILAPEYFAPKATHIDQSYNDFYNPYSDSIDSRSLWSLWKTKSKTQPTDGKEYIAFNATASASVEQIKVNTHDPKANPHGSFGYPDNFHFMTIENSGEIFVYHSGILNMREYGVYEDEMDGENVFNSSNAVVAPFIFQISKDKTEIKVKGKKMSLHVVRPQHYYEMNYLKKAFALKVPKENVETVLGEEFLSKAMDSEFLNQNHGMLWSKALYNSSVITERFSDDDRARNFDLRIDLSFVCKFTKPISELGHSN